MDKILTFRDLNKGVAKTCHTENIFFIYFYSLFTSGKLLKISFSYSFLQTLPAPTLDEEKKST